MGKVSKNILSFFAKNVRDAASEEEVNELVETTNDVLNEEPEQTVTDMSEDTEQKLLEVLLELSTVIKDLKGSKGMADADEVMKEEVIAEDEDPAMESLNELEDSCDEIEDEERPIEEVVESSQDIEDEDPAVPEETNTFSKIVKDMKPYLARISNSKERKTVCDALAKSLGRAKRSNNSYAQILKTTSEVRDSKSNNGEDLQSFYDSLNPHNKK